MADYSGGGPDWADSLEYAEGTARREELLEFWGSVRKNTACPRCGSHVEWSLIDATNAFTHMAWHDRLVSAIKVAGSPFTSLLTEADV